MKALNEKGIIAEQLITITLQRKRSVLSCESVTVQEQSAPLAKYAPFFAMLDHTTQAERLKIETVESESA